MPFLSDKLVSKVVPVKKPTGNNHSFDPKTFLTIVKGGRTVADYHKNQVVYQQEKSADSVFYIQKGKAKITVTSEQGKEAVVALLGPGDFFGEGCLNGQALRLASAIALTECTVMRIPKADMLEVIHNESAFGELFISYLLARNSRAEADLVDQLFNSSEKRLARTLLILANFGKEGDPEPVLAKISQETLAEIIGTTRARVNFFMNKFRRLGLIDYNGKITVHRSLLDLVLHEVPAIENNSSE
jgi:CRP/FNR family cyclic AMP-dependent transcriptional regulator